MFGNGFTTGQITYLPGTPIAVYSITMILGIFAAIITVMYFWKREKYSFEILLKIILITIPSAIIGARLFFIFERLIYNPGNPFPGSNWWAIWDGGLSIQGGVIVPLILNLIYLSTKRSVIDIKMAFGIILPTVLIGQVIGRWGNFANHEVYGNPTSYESIAWLGPNIAYNMFIDGAYRQPLFLYESLANLVGYILIVWVILNLGLLKPGSTGALYLLWYGIVRTAMEPLREEQYLYYSIMSIISIVAGILFLAFFEITGRKDYIIEKVGLIKFYKNKRINYNLVTTISTRWINE
ncbi:MAG: prolipoprotein diacylglyceryl transferase [Metamycoplasmataceae bacterium]